MTTAADAQGIPRYEETDTAPGGTFSGLLNLGMGWVSAALAPTGGTVRRSSDLANGVTAAGNAAAFQSITGASGMTWSAGQPTRLVASKAGRYVIRGRATVGSTGNGSIWVRVNGASSSDTPKVTAANVSGAAAMSLVEVVSLNAGEYVELWVQSSGTFTLFTATDLSADRISPRV